MCIETGGTICSYNGQLIFASSHRFAECSLLGVRRILALQWRRHPVLCSVTAEDRQVLWLWQHHVFQWAFRLCFGLRMLLYRVPFYALLPKFPANKRRGSDQYAESRRYLSAGGKQCRTCGTTGGGLNGSQLTQYKGPSAFKKYAPIPI